MQVQFQFTTRIKLISNPVHSDKVNSTMYSMQVCVCACVSVQFQTRLEGKRMRFFYRACNVRGRVTWNDVFKKKEYCKILTVAKNRDHLYSFRMDT